MSVEEPKRTLAYICPACRQSVIVERDLFSLAAATAHIKCPCGRSELRVWTWRCPACSAAGNTG